MALHVFEEGRSLGSALLSVVCASRACATSTLGTPKLFCWDGGLNRVCNDGSQEWDGKTPCPVTVNNTQSSIMQLHTQGQTFNTTRFVWYGITR